MNRARGMWLMACAALLVSPAAWAAHQGGLDVEVWTDRGGDAVYQPGDAMQVRVRTSDEAYLLVYEIDAEGRVRLLYPEQGSRGFVEGRETLRVPSPRSNLELVVEGPVGQGFIVAVASREPPRGLPWYLRPYDVQAEDVGYASEPADEEGVTREGRIVGDPYVAMERIRRRVLRDADDPDAFATSYTSYYVHDRVRYPRYLCYDCHRPRYWGWWDGFDPYYTTCRVFDFRVNWGWYWGPSYWFGYVPYYYYVYRYDCPPRYRLFTSRHACYSSWDGWPRWSSLWGGSLRRYKSDPPPGYVPPSKFDQPRDRWPKERPPGFLADRTVARGRHGGGLVPVTREARDDGRWFKGDRPTASEEAERRTVLGRPRGAWPDGRSSQASGADVEREPRARWRGRDDGQAFGRRDGAGQGIRREAVPDRSPDGSRHVGRRDEGSAWEAPRRHREESPRREVTREGRDESTRWQAPRNRDEAPGGRQEPRIERPQRGRNGGAKR